MDSAVAAAMLSTDHSCRRKAVQHACGIEAPIGTKKDGERGGWGGREEDLCAPRDPWGLSCHGGGSHPLVPDLMGRRIVASISFAFQQRFLQENAAISQVLEAIHIITFMILVACQWPQNPHRTAMESIARPAIDGRFLRRCGGRRGAAGGGRLFYPVIRQ